MLRLLFYHTLICIMCARARVQMLGALQKFGNTLEEYLHMILPPVVKLFDAHEIPINISKAAIQTIDLMAESLDFTDYASRIIHPLVSSVPFVAEGKWALFERANLFGWVGFLADKKYRSESQVTRSGDGFIVYVGAATAA